MRHFKKKEFYPKISILTSVYNGECFLRETLKSIEQQTFKSWELIAVDDGSADQSHTLLNEITKNRPGKFKIIHHSSNLGLTASLIEAAKQAKGEWLARIDVGDFWEPTKLEKQMEFTKGHPDHGIVGCQHVNVSLYSGKEVRVKLPCKSKEIESAIQHMNPFSHSSIVMRRDLYEQVGGYDPNVHYGQDYDLWFRLLKLTKGANLPTVLCRRSLDEASISSRRQREQMAQCIKTRWQYMNRMNFRNYAAMVEPLMLMVLPQRLKVYLRKIFR